MTTPMVMPARREPPSCRWHRYPSLDAAEAALAVCKALAATDPRRQETRVYACQHCAGWHLARDPEAKGCPSGKRAYPSDERAQQVLSAIWARPAPGQLPTRSYECQYCAKWHLTSKSQRDSAAIPQPEAAVYVHQETDHG